MTEEPLAYGPPLSDDERRAIETPLSDEEFRRTKAEVIRAHARGFSEVPLPARLLVRLFLELERRRLL